MLSWSALTAFMVLQLLGLPRGLKAAATASAAAASSPAPLVIPPSQSWDGNDGPWSSFSLRVGTPSQNFLVSTASNQPWGILPEGCQSTDPSDCPNDRGTIFQRNLSSSYYVPSWIRNESTESIFSLGVETNLGLSGNGLYGYDNVSLGSGMPSLSDQLVGGISTRNFFVGLFGVNPAATTFSANTSPVSSYLSSLKAQNLIPSLSYSYTAGNQYRFNKVLGSLTLGGFDASLFEPNDLTVAFSSTSDLTINVNSITMSARNGNRILGSTAFPAFIDSTVSYFYLPLEVCQKFEDAFGIVYDDHSGLYLVNDTLHTQLLSQAANVTFTLTNVTSKVLVDIVLPYQAFDLIAKWPLVQNETRYFPLKRAMNNSQTTLGRAFLQESYLIADYERSNFSIYQRKWDANAQPDVQPISLQSNSPGAHSSSQKQISVGVAVAITVGVAVVMTALIGGFIVIRQRKQKRKVLGLELQNSPGPSPPPPFHAISIHKDNDYLYKPVTVSPSLTFQSELDAASTQIRSPELGGEAFYFETLPTRSKDAIDLIHELPARETVDWDRFGMRDQKPRWI